MKRKHLFLSMILFVAIGTVFTSCKNGSDIKEVAAQEDITSFLKKFVNDCFINENFNVLLRDNSAKLKSYLDPKTDVRRYHAPGAHARLYSRAVKFGFDEYSDFTSKPVPKKFSITQIRGTSACSLDFGENMDKLYFAMEDTIRDEVDAETLQSKPVSIPYRTGDVATLYLPEKNGNPRAFHFVLMPSGWKLVIIDDALCGA